VVSEPGTPARNGSRPAKRKVTLGLAVLLAVLALAVGVVVGYVARGGPPDRVLVTTDQEIPVLTVTTPAESP
jgi:cell division septal protein FtsQ